MRALLIATLTLASATARAGSIFPAGGSVPQTPKLWISAAQMPRIEVTDDRGPVAFEIDELQVESGPRRIALRPQVGNGPFTVVLDGVAHRYQADSTLDRWDRAVADADLLRIAIERIRGRETFVIEAHAEPGTVLYLLNRSSSRAVRDNVFARYVWIGLGHPISTDPSTQRFELPLADLGVSCASASTIELTPYTTHIDGQTTVHSIGTLRLSRGKVALPTEMFGDADKIDDWQPCIGASRLSPALVRALAVTGARSGPSMVLSSLDSIRSPLDFSSSSLDDAAIYGGLLGPEPSFPVVSTSLDTREPTDSPWAPVLAILLALVLAYSSGRPPE